MAKMNPLMGSVKESGPRGAQPPKSKPNTSGVGNETKADMKGALDGNPTDKNPLRGAIQELGKQHPIRHDDLGPHHADTSHIRHVPMGLK
jgi:hypothetical protein